MVSYRVMLDVPRELILFVSAPAGRPPPPDRHAEGNPQAGLLPAGAVRAWPGSGTRATSRGWPGFGLSQSTAYRYLDEVIEVLAARAPGLREQLERALAEGRRT